jgi:hypothetical protein
MGETLSNNKKTWNLYTGHDTTYTYTITLPPSLKNKIKHNITYIRKTATRYVYKELKECRLPEKKPSTLRYNTIDLYFTSE